MFYSNFIFSCFQQNMINIFILSFIASVKGFSNKIHQQDNFQVQSFLLSIAQFAGHLMACLRIAWRVSMKPSCVVQPTVDSCMTIDCEISMRFHIITSWASPGKFFWKIHFPLYHRKVKKERRMFPIQYRLGLWSEKMCFCRAPVPYMDMLHWRGWTYKRWTRKKKEKII